MSENVDPLMNESSTVGQEALVDASGASSSGSRAFPWVESAVLTRTSILLSPESITPFKNIVRRRFPEVRDAGALQPYIVEMSSNKEGFVPTMDAKAMRAFSRNNKRKQGSQASGPVITTETEQEVSSSKVSDKLVSKKSCTDKGPVSSSVPPSPNLEVGQVGKPVSSGQALLVTPGIPKWWHWFQGFEGQPGTEVTSVFDRRLPTEQLVRSHFCKVDDFVRVKKVGILNTAKMVQVFTAQTAVLGYALETGVGLLEKELKEKTKKLKDGEAEVAKAKEASSELECLHEDFKTLSLEKEKVVADLAELEKEKVKSDTLLTEKTKLLEVAEEKLAAEQKDRKEESDHLKAEITFQYEQGFDKVIDQVKFLHPEINVDEAGAFKEIRDGQLFSSTELCSMTPLYVMFVASMLIFRRAVLDDTTLSDLQCLSSAELCSTTPLYVVFVASMLILHRAMLDDTTLRDVCSFNAYPPPSCARRHHST
ncbi:hypothetical protein SESBI_18086 [Sesbania bispinosa]|nr:hypothetical protein SESBI_18086 [Sesbania bispinosa]